MADIAQNYWIIGLVALLAIAVILWLVLRPRRSDTPSLPKAPTAPLQPNKPQIIAAEPARFAAAEPAPAIPPPVPEVAPVMAPAAGPSDNLALLKGVGPKLVAMLAGLGVTRFDQIAGWTEADIAAIDARLGTFSGRITRDNWVDQAAFLARGDRAGFEAKYGALGGEL